jgi:site-specific DNA recombinase
MDGVQGDDPSTTAGHQRPREEWIEIPVPALVTEQSFARAEELLYQNKIRSRRARCRAGAGQLCEAWLRPVANIAANQRT